MEILICTDGTEISVKAAELVTKFGFPVTTNIVVLGVSQGGGDIMKLSESCDLIEESICKDFPVRKKIRHGNPIDEIMAEVLENSYDLVVVGGGGSQMGILHPQIGSTTEKLARKLDTHFLVARNIPEQFEKILVCGGPDTPASETMNLGGKLISNTKAQIALLHVLTSSQVGSDTDQPVKFESDSALMEHFTQQLRQAGVKNNIQPRVRSGLVVEEVLKELTEGMYQLLVVGSHYLSGQDLWQGTLLDDITEQLLNKSNCSVLII